MTHLRDYQAACVDDALRFYDEVASADEAGIVRAGRDRRRAYAAPTGSGKTRCMVEIQRTLVAGGADAWVVTPSLEIARGFLREHGVVDQPTGDEALFTLAESYRVSTPTRLMNRMVDGRRAVPDVFLIDEVHHAIEQNEVSGCAFNLGPGSVWLGWTATPYRGTPAGTAALREAWGEPYLLLTYPEAAAAGAVVIPSVEVIPLVDDDLVKIVNGEFQEKASSAAVGSKVAQLAALIKQECCTPKALADCLDCLSSGVVQLGDGETVVCNCIDEHSFVPLVPTLVAVPSTDCVNDLVSALDAIGVEAAPVTQATSAAARQKAFDDCKARRAVLVQIKVVSEGVDLPWLGCAVDARPVVSPVAWLQFVGRLTRPGHGPKRLVVTNRNVERHAYLLQGALPREAVASAQAAFGGPSKRAAGRIVGLEALTKLKPLVLPLAGGVKSTYYSVWRIEDGRRAKYVVLHRPTHDEPFVAKAVDEVEPGQPVAWGKWQVAALPAAFDGFATSKRTGAASDKAKAWWKRRAAALGLDADHDPAGRDIDALAMLEQCNIRL